MPDKERVTEAEDIFEEGRGPKELQEFLRGLHEKYGHLGEKAKKESKSKEPESEEVKETEEPQEILPEQGNLVGKFVDVEDKNGNRLGIGKCLREDFGPPWKNEVRMVIPPFQKDKILTDVRIKLSPTQQIMD